MVVVRQDEGRPAVGSEDSLALVDQPAEYVRGPGGGDEAPVEDEVMAVRQRRGPVGAGIEELADGEPPRSGVDPRPEAGQELGRSAGPGR